ncbi:MAG TPA: DUF4382 domain-containing protein [Pseudomonadales bacterium]
MRSGSSLLTAAVAALITSGCGGGGGDHPIGVTPTGTLSVSLTDAPVDDMAEVWVHITGMRLKPADGAPIDFTFAEPKDIDLLTLTASDSVPLLDGETVPAGNYEWIALDVDADFDNVFDSYVLDNTGGMIELRVPSQQGVRLVSGFTVLAGGTTRLMLDWDLRRALTDPTGQPGYFLRPALRITDLAEYGAIVGTVADDLLTAPTCDNDLAEDRGNVVYLYEGADVVPVDIDGGDPEPLATGRVAQDAGAAGAYTYRIDFVPPGDYTVAFTCQGLADDPEVADTLAFIGPQTLTVVADEEAVADF